MEALELKTCVRDATREALVGSLSDYERVVEIGIGNRSGVAAGLADCGVTVLATDIRPRSVPAAVSFELDDITTPTVSLYDGADALYGLNLPPELHQPAHDLARRVGADFCFTTLGGDPPAIPVRREQLPGETLYRAIER